MQQTSRSCDACGGTELVELHKQEFALVGQDRAFSYRVVACSRCDFVFATDVPDQHSLEAYYREHSRHVYGASLPQGLANIHDDFFHFLNDSLLSSVDKNTYRIVEVGCASGHFLNRMREDGFTQLSGVEPSAAAALEARELFGLPVQNVPLGQFESNEPFDLVVMSGVLEHIVDLGPTIDRISDFISEDGHVCWLVPDAARFHEIEVREPYFEFALEHVNFFSRNSLGRLAARYALQERACISRHNDFYNNYNLMTLYRKQRSGVESPPRDPETVDHVRQYIEISRKELDAIDRVLAPQVDARTPLIVWGTGMLTSRLLTDSALKDARIAHFVDSNPTVQGQTLCGTVIESPAILRGKRHPVVVASLVYQDEIHASLLSELAYEGPIITFSRSAS